MAKKIKIGTRNSKLALWQAEHVSDVLSQHGFDTEIIAIETKGDKVLNVSISKIGSKGVFTEELEEMLRDGSVSIAVHSAKDVQSSLQEGFELIAFSQRETPTDVLVSREKIDLNTKVRIGTSSTRRRGLLRHYYPQLELVDMRGNLQTRIAKMDDGKCDALLLAYAGVHRMGYDELITHHLDIKTFTPPVGQGALAIECHQGLDSKLKAAVRDLLNDSHTEKCLLTERAFLKTLEGGCSIPSFGHATFENGEVIFNCGLVSLDGSKIVRKTMRGSSPEEVGVAGAKELLKDGGDEILKKIKEELV